MAKIETLEQVCDALQRNGYEAELSAADAAVMVMVGGTTDPFTAVITPAVEDASLVINCQLARMGDFPEGNTGSFMLAALDANSRIRPYAFAVLTDSDDPSLDDPADWPVVLTNRIPLGDLSEGEVVVAMGNLWEAVLGSKSVLEIGLGA